MTQLDVVFRYGVAPSEAAALALSRVREVYGVRGIAFNESEKTVCVEYDATRLNEATIQQLLRRTGFDIVEKVQQYTDPPPPPEPTAAAPAPSK